jgi:Arc/MetJ-type ribon-helix-helix transcriptional regulator
VRFSPKCWVLGIPRSRELRIILDMIKYEVDAMRTTKAISITLPEPMLDTAKARARKENRTMSELVREALRRYEASQWLAEMQRYGQERAVAVGVLKEEDVDRVVHEARKERRKITVKSRVPRRRAS